MIYYVRFVVGFLLVMAGVGGIEHSQNSVDMFTGLYISLMGLAILAWGIVESKFD